MKNLSGKTSGKCHLFILVTLTHRVVCFSPPIQRCHAGRSLNRLNPRISHKRLLFSSETLEGYEEWESGNVFEDLDRLERAIAFANADEDLAQKERLEMLDSIAANKRLIYPDLESNVLKPMIISFWLAGLMKITLKSFPMLTRTINLASDLHFALCVVGAPILLYVSKALFKPKASKEEIPRELRGIDQSYLRFVTSKDFQDPQKSCRDHVQCILEQWISAIAGVIMLNTYNKLFQRLDYLNSLPFCIELQLINRLAAMLSLHQYPKLWFQLTRSGQPRPVTWEVWATQAIIPVQIIPYSLVPDMARIWVKYSWATLAGISLSVTTVLAMLRLFPEADCKPQQLLSNAKKILLVLGLVGFYKCYPVFRTCTFTLAHAFEKERVFKIIEAVAITIAWACPVAHVLSFFKILRVSKSHNISLSDPEYFRKWIQSKEAVQRSARWRWRLNWREPRRIRTTLQSFWGGFWYWVLLSGSVEDQQMRQNAQLNRQSGKRENSMHVLQRLAKELEAYPDDPMTDRTKWKQRAMDRIARKHQNDYDKGTFDVRAAVSRFARGIGH